MFTKQEIAAMKLLKECAERTLRDCTDSSRQVRLMVERNRQAVELASQILESKPVGVTA